MGAGAITTRAIEIVSTEMTSDYLASVIISRDRRAIAREGCANLRREN
jgi:HJR/Mrr/RecB family endonuclease